MILVTHENIKSLRIPVGQYYSWTVEMIKNKNKAILPPKISMKPFSGVFCNVMPSIIKSGSHMYGGVKIVKRYPNRIPSLDSQILLYDVKTGEYLAMLDGDWITAMRTGAVAAHSIMLLAKKNYRIIGAMGLGNVTRATVLILLELNPQKKFHFKLYRYKGQEESFVQRFSKYKNFSYEFVDTYRDAVRGSDVVISGVTYAPEDFCKDEDFDAGVLVVPIHTLGFTNCDLFFDKVFADDYGHVCGFKNFVKFKSFAEVSDVVCGTKHGRENDEERILAYNIGISVHDINFAGHVYELVKNEKEVNSIELNGPIEKFWI